MGENLMRKKIGISIILIIIMFVITACSTGGSGQNSVNDNENNELDNADVKHDNDENESDEVPLKHDSSLEGEITFWSWGDWIDEVEAFNKIYPNIKVNVVTMEIDELHDKLHTTISAGSGAPDVSHVLGAERYSDPGLLEDLLDPRYDMGRYEHLTAPYVWERWKSIDGKRLLAPPWDIAPGVFYYREDIYDQMGLSTDPDELGEFLQDEDNVFMAAQTLAANDIYMYEFRDSPAIQYGDALGYFDSELNYTRNTDRMVELLDIVKRGVQIGWAPQISVLFSDEGKELLKQGRVASFPAASNGRIHLENVVPEQSGKWRATKMPFGVNASLVGSSFVLPSQSENKDAAFAFIEFIAVDEEAWKIYLDGSVQSGWKFITSLPWYDEFESEYLGGQQEFSLYDTLVDEIPVRRFTPLDGAAWPLYIDQINESIDKNIDSKTTLQQIEENTMKQLAPDIEEMKEIHGIE